MRFAFVTALGWLFVVLPLRAESVSLAPAADTTLFENDPNNNLGRATLAAGSLASQASANRARALIKFNVSSIPPNAVVTNVTLTVRVSKSPPGPVTSTFGLHRVLRDWGEGTRTASSGSRGAVAAAGEATWNNRFTGQADAAWSSPGGSSSVDYVGQASGTRSIAGNASYTFDSSAGLIADVQTWIAEPNANFGWMMISESEGVAKTARRFVSKEGAAAQAPALVVQYSLGPAVTAPSITTQPLSQTVIAGDPATLSVVAAGTEPLAYQWKLNGNDLAGETAATFSLPQADSGDAGSYTVVVSNSAGTATSDPATLIVIESVRFDAITLAGAVASLRFTVPAGYDYEVQRSSTMALGSWQTLTNVTAKFAPVQAVVDEPAGSGFRFYRLFANQVD